MNTPQTTLRRFVQIAEAVRETSPWAQNEWLCRPDVVEADKLLCVRVNMEAGRSHPFHYHPHREEILYVLYGRAEQWVGEEKRLIGPGDVAHIPAGLVHGTYNPHLEPVVFLAILSPAKLAPGQENDPDPQDVSTQEPWKSMRNGLPPCR